MKTGHKATVNTEVPQELYTVQQGFRRRDNQGVYYVRRLLWLRNYNLQYFLRRNSDLISSFPHDSDTNLKGGIILAFRIKAALSHLITFQQQDLSSLHYFCVPVFWHRLQHCFPKGECLKYRLVFSTRYQQKIPFYRRLSILKQGNSAALQNLYMQEKRNNVHISRLASLSAEHVN